MNEPMERNSVSLMEIVGGYSACLVLAAILIALTAVIVRRQRSSIFSACAVMGIAFAGLGASFWSLSAMNRPLIYGDAGVDPYSWLGDFGVSCASAGAVLPACGTAMVLVGISFLFPKREVISLAS
jgi:hypothetical protein